MVGGAWEMWIARTYAIEDHQAVFGEGGIEFCFAIAGREVSFRRGKGIGGSECIVAKRVDRRQAEGKVRESLFCERGVSVTF